MPFNKENAASLGSKGGRWTKPPESVRNKQLLLNVTQAEHDAISEKAKRLRLSKTELVVRAVTEYDEED